MSHLAALILAISTTAAVPTPESFLGHPVAADFKLAGYGQVAEYFRRVDEASDRVQVRTLGTTTEGRPMILAEISSPANLKASKKIRAAQHRLADPRRIKNAKEEAELVAHSPVVVMINCNLHSTEIASSQLALELLHYLATEESADVQEMLDRCVVLLVPSANPDGLDKVVDWYRSSLGKPWEASGMPWLYQKYAGHDNNRDWFMLALQETRLLTHVLYDEWRPTIVYDIHQMGNSNARMMVPPFHDPKNPNLHPLLEQSLMIIGGRMATELARQNKSGVVHSAIYDNYWAGGFRTIPYRHNMVGILTEAASPRVASPIFQEKSQLKGGGRGMPDYQVSVNFPQPWPGGWWRLRDVADYERTCVLSLLSVAARLHDMFQANYIQMGREAIERGRSTPPYAWIVPTDQPDRGETLHLLRLMHATGVEVHTVREAFESDGGRYPAGTFILRCDQPYRPYLVDMFERQNYPDRAKYPGGPAESPYDIAGWTLPLQLGVLSVAATKPLDVAMRKLESIPDSETSLHKKNQSQRVAVTGGLNDLFKFRNRLRSERIEASIVTADADEAKHAEKTAATWTAGSIVLDGVKIRESAEELFDDLALSVRSLADDEKLPELEPLRPLRLALYQPWLASMDEGWTRLVLENHEYEYTSLHNGDVRAGGLAKRFDTIVLPSMEAADILKGRKPDESAPDYIGGIERDGVVALQEFVQVGGSLVTIDESCLFAIEQFGLPVKNRLAGRDSKEFYCPGSILRLSVDTQHSIGLGVPAWTSCFFTDSLAFELADGGSRTAKPATVVARYGDTQLLESGWIRGEKLIAGQPALVEVPYGQGQVVLFGFRVQHRAQTHVTFPLLFNALEKRAANPAK